jgi:conjugal transfer pilus assembly protein TraU
MIKKLLLPAFTAIMLSLALPGMAIGAENGSEFVNQLAYGKG